MQSSGQMLTKNLKIPLWQFRVTARLVERDGFCQKWECSIFCRTFMRGEIFLIKSWIKTIKVRYSLKSLNTPRFASAPFKYFWTDFCGFFPPTRLIGCLASIRFWLSRSFALTPNIVLTIVNHKALTPLRSDGPRLAHPSPTCAVRLRSAHFEEESDNKLKKKHHESLFQGDQSIQHAMEYFLEIWLRNDRIDKNSCESWLLRKRRGIVRNGNAGQKWIKSSCECYRLSLAVSAERCIIKWGFILIIRSHRSTLSK